MSLRFSCPDSDCRRCFKNKTGLHCHTRAKNHGVTALAEDETNPNAFDLDLPYWHVDDLSDSTSGLSEADGLAASQ
jgi:hypothetical protein